LPGNPEFRYGLLGFDMSEVQYSLRALSGERHFGKLLLGEQATFPDWRDRP